MGLNINLLRGNGRGVSSVTDNTAKLNQSRLCWISTRISKEIECTSPPMKGLSETLCKDDFEFVSQFLHTIDYQIGKCYTH